MHRLSSWWSQRRKGEYKRINSVTGFDTQANDEESTPLTGGSLTPPGSPGMGSPSKGELLGFNGSGPGFVHVMKEYWMEQHTRSKKHQLSRTVADEWGFRVLVMMTILCYILFFSVAIAKITTPAVTNYRGPPPNVAKRTYSASDSYWTYTVEFLSYVLHAIFHNNWFGMFAHYDHRPAISTQEQQLEEVLLIPKEDTEVIYSPGEQQDQEHDLWYIGVILALIGTMVAALGNHFVTLAHKLSAIEERESGTSASIGLRDMAQAFVNRRSRQHVSRYMFRPSFLFWLLGNVAITILGTVLTLVSFAFASQALLAPLSGLTIVWNALLATTKWFGGQILSKRDVMATLFTLLGCVFIVIAGPRETKHYSLDELLEKFSRWIFQLYALCAMCLTVILYRISENDSRYSIDNQRLARGIMPGLMGGFSNVLAKACVELASQGALFSSFTSVFIVLTAGSAAFCQLTWINKALAKFEPLFIVPVYQATLLISSTLSGALYYGDFDQLSLMQYILFGFGVSGIIVGVTMLAGSSSSSSSSSSSTNSKVEAAGKASIVTVSLPEPPSTRVRRKAVGVNIV